MYRPIIYTAEQVRSTDILFGFQQNMIALSKLAAAILGTSTICNGFACTPTSPNTLTVNIAPGEIYSMGAVDATAYGVLPADTTDQILKQGIVLATDNIACPAPTTSGYSINYLIEAEFQEVDAVDLLLPFYNSANPSQPYSGQGNSGAPLPTQRQGSCLMQAKAGAAAPTGTQVTPTPDAGFVGLWVVTVAYGQSGIASANIAQYSGANFITTTLPQLASTAFARLNATQAWTAGQSGTPVALAFGASVTPTFASANNFTVAVSANFQLANPANVVPGQSGVIEFNQNATGGYAITSFGGQYIAANGTKPQLQAGANGTDVFSYYVNSANKIVLTAVPKVA